MIVEKEQKPAKEERNDVLITTKLEASIISESRAYSISINTKKNGLVGEDEHCIIVDDDDEDSIAIPDGDLDDFLMMLLKYRETIRK